MYDAGDSFRLARVGPSTSLFPLRVVNNNNYVKHFPLPTSSMSSLVISPSGNHIVVWEGPLEVCHNRGVERRYQ